MRALQFDRGLGTASPRVPLSSRSAFVFPSQPALPMADASPLDAYIAHYPAWAKELARRYFRRGGLFVSSGHLLFFRCGNLFR